MSAQLRDEETIFEIAREKKTPEELTAFLDKACVGAPPLRKRVEALLKSHNDAGSFLEKPPVEIDSGELPDSQRSEAPAEPVLSDEIDLSFLDPCDKPDCLGQLGPYEITEVIGSGGMGVVLKGRDSKLNRILAIKVLAPQFAANTTGRKRFLREGRAAAAISHDHVVTIHGIDETGQLPYLMMEYIDGLSLQQRIDRDGPLELTEILRIGKQTALGLAAAHAEGLIHRDIKPANILLENGVERVKITDFGLARAVDDVTITQAGVVTGTPQYMSPEQAQNESLDHRSDLFSLGSVLYAMCTSRPPFRGDSTVAVIRRVCDATLRPIREVNPEIPDWLVAIIDRLLAKNPDERFQTASELADLLGKHLAHVQDPTRMSMPVLGLDDEQEADSLSHSVAGSKPSRHRPWVIATAVLLLLVGGLGMTEATGVTKFVSILIEIWTPHGTLIVDIADPDVTVKIDGRDYDKGKVFSPVFSGGRQARAITLSPGDILVSDAPEFGGNNGKVIHVDPSTGLQILISSGGFLNRPLGIVLDASGQILVTDEDVFDGAVISIDPISGVQTVLSTAVSSAPSGIAVDGAGALYVSEQLSHQVVKVDPGSGTILITYSGNFNKPMLSAFDLAGNLIVPNRGNGSIVRLDPTTGQQEVISSGNLFGGTPSVAVEADGDILVAGSGIVRVDPLTGDQELVSRGGILSGSLTGIALEADGQILVADRSNDKLFRVDPTTGAQSVVSSGGLFVEPFGVFIIPALEPPTVISVGPSAIYAVIDNNSIGVFDDLGDLAVDVSENNHSQVGDTVSIHEDFSDPLDPTLFTISNTDTHSTFGVSGGVLSFVSEARTAPPDEDIGGTLLTNFLVEGDFDASVTFSDFSAPFEGGARWALAQLGAQFSSGGFFGGVTRLKGQAADVNNVEARVAPVGLIGEFATSASSGLLRTVRIGNTYEAYFNDNLFASGTVSEAPLQLRLLAWRHRLMGEFTVSFDEFQITADSIVPILDPAATRIYVVTDNNPGGVFDDLVADSSTKRTASVGEADSSDTNKMTRLVVKFELPALPNALFKLESATLRFFFETIVGTPAGPLSLTHSVTDNDLDPLASDYENPSYVDTLLDLIQPTDRGGQFYELDVTELVLADYAADGLDALCAFRLEVTEAVFFEDDQSNHYRLRMPGLESHRPELILVFSAVPEPSNPRPVRRGPLQPVRVRLAEEE